MLLDHLGWSAYGDALRAAVHASVRAKQKTEDLGGTLGTREAGDWLAEYVTTHAVQARNR
jgi:isocitrate/isopropylmalate dehydrogenase